MNLVDEQHIVLLERSEYTRKVAGLVEHRTGCDLEIHTQLIGDNACECGLAESGRSEQQQVVQCLATHTRSLDEHFEILNNLFLTVERVEIRRAQRALEFLVRI